MALRSAFLACLICAAVERAFGLSGIKHSRVSRSSVQRVKTGSFRNSVCVRGTWDLPEDWDEPDAGASDKWESCIGIDYGLARIGTAYMSAFAPRRLSTILNNGRLLQISKKIVSLAKGELASNAMSM